MKKIENGKLKVEKENPQALPAFSIFNFQFSISSGGGAS